jgi:ABC-type multidrug transport system ATPase subunit
MDRQRQDVLVRMSPSAIATELALGSRPAASSTDTPLVELMGLWRSWGRGKARRDVLRGVDLRIAPGTATSLTGRNGAGKTTLLRIITGILAPDRGDVAIEGVRPTDNWREYHRRIGFLSAGDRGLYARVTVRGHLDHWTSLALVPRGERRQRVEETLESFDLAELAKRRAERLSQGQRQRLRLALTVVHRPKVLLLDEPRNSLDAEGRALLAAAVSDVLRRGGAVLCCSPAGEDHLEDCDRRAVIDDGLLSFV